MREYYLVFHSLFSLSVFFFLFVSFLFHLFEKQKSISFKLLRIEVSHFFYDLYQVLILVLSKQSSAPSPSDTNLAI